MKRVEVQWYLYATLRQILWSPPRTILSKDMINSLNEEKFKEIMQNKLF